MTPLSSAARPSKRRLTGAPSAIALLLLTGATAKATPTIVILDLGTLGGSLSEATAVNSNGQVIGFSSPASDAAIDAFSWTPAGGMVNLGSLGGNYTIPRAVNSNGEVVGSSATSICEVSVGPNWISGGNCEFNDAHAFLWTESGGMVDLGTLGGRVSYATDINESGQVVGRSWTLDDASEHAFLWTAAGGMVDLGTLPGGDRSGAIAINDSGQVIGTSSVVPHGLDHAFLWTESGGMVDLGTLGGTRSFPTDLNESGQVVGASLTPGDASEHAFLWTAAGGMVDLGTLPGGLSSYAAAINASAQVAGSNDAVDGNPYYGFVWSAADGIVSLGALGASYSFPSDINDAGQIVGDYGPVAGAKFRPFLWTASDGMVDLGTLGGITGRAYAVNASGLIVGFAYNSSDAVHAVLWEIVNTPSGTDVTVQPTDAATGATPVTLTFAVVTEAGNTSLTIGTTGPTPPAGFTVGDPPVFYDLTTTAVFSAPVDVCINYGGVTFSGTPSLFHYEDGAWADRTTSVDATNQVICARVSSLSPFAVFGPRVPKTKAECKAGGWETLRRQDGTPFKNQGACVSYVNTGR